MENLVIAGACSVFGLSEIKAAFFELGFSVTFVDAPFMAGIKIHEFVESEEITYTAELPENALVIPLSEYWISYCKKHGNCRISQNALESSRSKEFFYRFLEQQGFEAPEIYESQTLAEKALEAGKRIIIKPVGLHSGYGIEVIDKNNRGKISEYMAQAAGIKNRTLRLMEIENKGVMLTEAVEGPEYSADCFYFQGRISVIRICRKLITVIKDKPCCAAYKLLCPGEAEYEKFRDFLEAWTDAVFDKDNISFAQYDFIESPEGHVVPVDFACRVGGGISDLLIESGRNPYALGVAGKSYSLESGLCQFNYLPVASGYIKNENYPFMEGHQFKRVFKKKGDYVISNPSSVGSRIAVSISHGIQEFSEKIIPGLLLGNDFIGTEKLK